MNFKLWSASIMIEHLWRFLKYECLYLHAFETGNEVQQGLRRWIDFYNTRRPHSSLDDKTPDEAYWQKPRPGYAGPSPRLAA
jgi:putative transposase